MNSLLPLMLAVVMMATVVVLAVGIVSFAFNAQLNSRYGNKIMTARVVLQFVAIAIFGLIVLLTAA